MRLAERDLVPLTPVAATPRFFPAEIGKWREVVKKANLKLD